MKIPIWKKWLSHIKPLELETASSDLNPDLQIILDKGRLQLVSGNAIYSWDDLYRNFTIAFGELDLDSKKYENVLILGLGLASIPYILEKTYKKKYHYTAIELDEEVIQLAMKYTIPRLDSSVDVVTADAEVFVEVCEEKFDMLIVDIFEDEITPPQFETPEFLTLCTELLAPGGMLMFNRLYHSLADKTATQRYYEKVFSKVLPGAQKIDTIGNWILCYEKSL